MPGACAEGPVEPRGLAWGLGNGAKAAGLDFILNAWDGVGEQWLKQGVVLTGCSFGRGPSNGGGAWLSGPPSSCISLQGLDPPTPFK